MEHGIKCSDCRDMAEATLDGKPLCPGCYEEEVFMMKWEEENDDSNEEPNT